MDWKDALQNFKESHDLPAGSDDKQEPSAPTPAPKLPTLEIVYERKGRAGKPATIICGFDPDDEATLRDVASQLKRALACGGSQRAGEILLQGDRRHDAARLLRGAGYKVKGV